MTKISNPNAALHHVVSSITMYVGIKNFKYKNFEFTIVRELLKNSEVYMMLLRIYTLNR